MTHLTDDPGAAEAVLPGTSDWRRLAEADPLSRVWRILGGDRVGYRAGPDGRVLVVIDAAPRSQFAAITEALRAGAELPDGLGAMALTGTGFRGQRGRSWEALRGNLHLTAHYRVDLPASGAAPALTMAPVVAAARAIETLAPVLRPRIKWVNDVLLDGRKIAGVLTATDLRAGRIRHAVFGIGLNLEVVPDLPPTRFVPAATCLADHAPDLRGRLDVVLEAVMTSLDQTVDYLRSGSQDVLFREYRDRLDSLGREVEIWPEDADHDMDNLQPLARGMVRDLCPDLSLVLDGMAEPVTRGRLAYR